MAAMSNAEVMCLVDNVILLLILKEAWDFKKAIEHFIARMASFPSLTKNTSFPEV